MAIAILRPSGDHEADHTGGVSRVLTCMVLVLRRDRLVK
jgi:hypothetical protein